MDLECVCWCWAALVMMVLLKSSVCLGWALCRYVEIPAFLILAELLRLGGLQLSSHLFLGIWSTVPTRWERS